jgi:hypothetical protein
MYIALAWSICTKIKFSPKTNIRVTKYVYIKSTTVYVLSSLQTPLSPASEPLPPEPGGGAHSLGGEGLGSPNSDD